MNRLVKYKYIPKAIAVRKFIKHPEIAPYISREIKFLDVLLIASLAVKKPETTAATMHETINPFSSSGQMNSPGDRNKRPIDRAPAENMIIPINALNTRREDRMLSILI